RRSSSGARTTTARARPGCATTTARTRSSAARASSGAPETRTRPKGTVRWRGAVARRALRGRVLWPALGPPAGVDPPPDLQGGRLGARPRRRRRLQTLELDDAADGARGAGRRARRP